MVRYQEALKNHLLKREEKLTIQLREADNELKVNNILLLFLLDRNLFFFFFFVNLENS
jgi:hypothetical protein